MVFSWEHKPAALHSSRSEINPSRRFSMLPFATEAVYELDVGMYLHVIPKHPPLCPLRVLHASSVHPLYALCDIFWRDRTLASGNCSSGISLTSPLCKPHL